MFTDLPACISLLLYVYNLCLIYVYTANLSFHICGHGLIFIPLLIKASFFNASSKMANRNEALFKANKRRLLSSPAAFSKVFS